MGARNAEGALPVDLTGRWALITGGSKGIGRAIADVFADAGANLVLVARDEHALAEAKAELAERVPHVKVITRSVDLTDLQAVDELFDHLAEAIDRLDVVVANAGAGRVTPFLEIPLDEWEWTLNLNLTSVFRCVQRAAQRMVGENGDDDRAILVVSSIRANGVRAGRLAYATSKAGLNQFARAAAGELAEHGIRVNILSPGITMTPLAADPANSEVVREAIASVPMGRGGEPEDMARAALYLCSPAAGFVTGTNLVVDGGENLS